MPIIDYKASNFPSVLGPRLQGKSCLHVSWADLIWAAISVGKQGYNDLSTHGQFSLYEIFYRTYTIFANLQQEKYKLSKSPLYNSLDPSEKASVSYSLGMTIPKLFGLKLLNISWLIHLKKLQSIYNITFHNNKRPDLLGLNSNGDWIVMEGKGRTNRFSQSVLNYAKQQTRSIRHISGRLPVLRVAVETYFSNTLSVQLNDPDDFEEDATDFELDTRDFLDCYYKPFYINRNELHREISLNSEKYYFIEEKSIGVGIGISQEIIERVEDREVSAKAIFKTINEYERKEVEFEDHFETTVYPDGLFITLDDRWSEENMGMPPERRTKY